jgi:hypothetical protein
MILIMILTMISAVIVVRFHALASNNAVTCLMPINQRLG